VKCLAIRGDNMRENFGTIYEENFSRVLAFIYNMVTDWALAEDITQEAFINAYKKIDSFRGGSSITSWLYKIAYNIFLDYKKKKKPEIVSLKLAEGFEIPITDRDYIKEIEKSIMSECVKNKILVLPEIYRAPLFLDIEGYSNNEISNILGYSLENTKIRLHRARKKIKEILSKECSLYYDERNVLCCTPKKK
jgi:RNA polymerase sigma-70 factor, ECF subfamily